MDYLDETGESAMLLSADFEKAFDCLEWSFIDFCLKHFKLPISQAEYQTTVGLQIYLCLHGDRDRAVHCHHMFSLYVLKSWPVY